jgi:hypothetical protein
MLNKVNLIGLLQVRQDIDDTILFATSATGYQRKISLADMQEAYRFSYGHDAVTTNSSLVAQSALDFQAAICLRPATLLGTKSLMLLLK